MSFRSSRSARAITCLHLPLVTLTAAVLGSFAALADSNVPYNRCSVTQDFDQRASSKEASNQAQSQCKPTPPDMSEATFSGEHYDWTALDKLSDTQKSLTGPGCDGLYREPANPGPEARQNPASSPLRLAADKVDFSDSEHAVLEGNVEIYQGNRRLRSDRVILDREAGTVDLSGNVQIREPGLLLRGEQATLNNVQHTTNIEQASYLVHKAHARGGADKIERRADQKVVLTGGQYTSCEPENKNWELVASRIELDPQTGFGNATHARFHIGDIPVFYFPYVEFPIDNRRKTGLLWPTFSQTSNGGVDLAVPVYLNLAENYDATLVPRFINNHGWLSEVEGRYLNDTSYWIIGGAYLEDDEMVGSQKAEDYPQLDTKRWVGRVTEEGQFNDHWSSWIDYQAVSDNNYFRDLGTTGLDIRRDVQLKQHGGIAYSNPHWSFQAKAEDYQTLVTDSNVTEPYTLTPRFNLLRQNTLQNFRLTPLFKSEYSFFEHVDKPRGQRIYAEPGLSYPMHGLIGFIEPSVKIKHTRFDLNDSNDLLDSPVRQDKGAVETTVPTFSLDSGLFFERDLRLGEAGYLQTLEPRLFYYYADYEEQQALPLFDTAQLEFNYNQLFRDNRFSSYDRIGDANQLSFGLTSRLYTGDTGKEVLTAGIGQVFYFRDRLVNINPTAPQKESSSEIAYKHYYRRASDIASQIQWRPGQRWTVIGNALHDPYNDKFQEGGVNLQFISQHFNLFNVGYRYRRQDPLRSSNGELLNVDTEQTDISTVIALNRQWSLFARWNYDLTDQHSIEDLSGVEFNNCCWRARLLYQRERESFENDQPKSETDPLEYDYAVFFQIEFKGLGSVSDNVSAILSESIPGYTKREKYTR